MPIENPARAAVTMVAVFLLGLSWVLNAAPEESAAPSPAGPALLAEVVARLPQQPLRVHGDIIVRRRHGIVERSFKFDMRLSWGRDPSEASYTIRDAFGRPLEEMTVRRSADGLPEYRYATGDPPAPAPTPDLFGPLQASDISWTDLSLSFLWWPNATVVATNEVRGRRCYVVEVSAPPSVAREADAGRPGAYRRARLWIDAEILMLLQAEGYDMLGDCIRRLSVKSFKKINDEWMVKDLEFEELPEGPRTVLRVRNAEPVKSDQPAAGLP